ncbi:MAG TPA: hypothetical protein VGM21_05590 [Actinomycetota bacterium]|jgi:hypothetical protein
MSLPTDYESAQGVLAHVRQLAGRLDLDHPDGDYQASVADRLADAAHLLAHDLRLLARGRRLRHHLAVVHGEHIPQVDRSVAEWLADHDRRHAEDPDALHDHPDDLAPYREFTGVYNADDLDPYDLP